MVITTTGMAGEKINFDKLYVSESGTKVDLSLAFFCTSFEKLSNV